MGLSPTLFVRRALFYGVFSLGIMFGFGISLWAYSLSFELILTVLEWVFPQYVILHPIDYAGPLPDAAAIIVLIFVVIAYFISLRGPNEQYRASFQNTRQSVDQGQLARGLVKIVVLTSLFGLYIGYFAWSVAVVVLTFVPGI